MELAIQNCVIWVVGHEIGHQLGLRHNFVGNELDQGYGSIMDYIEFFDNYEKFIQQDFKRLRTYDLHAIKYGYIPIKGEHIGNKPDELNEIAKVEIPFKTDDHFFDDVIPNVGRLEDQRDILDYISKAIYNYQQFRKVILNKLESNNITPYQYANGFLFIYINRYKLLLSMLCKYIGGRYIDFKSYRQVPVNEQFQSLSLLLHLKEQLKYNKDEYQHIIYDFSDDIDKHSPIIKVDNDEYNYYGFNSTNLFIVYQNLTDYYLKTITKKNNLIRLNSGDYQYSYDILYQFTFCIPEENNTFQLRGKGVFSEIGYLLNNLPVNLIDSDIFDQYCQYSWIDRMVWLKENNKHYFIQTAIDQIFDTVLNARDIIIQILKQQIDNNKQSRLILSHYNIIWEKINKTKQQNKLSPKT